MNYIFFIYIILIYTFLTPMNFSFAMEKENESNIKYKAFTSAHQKDFEQKFERINLMAPSLEKANKYAEQAALLESFLLHQSPELQQGITTMRLMHLLCQGNTLYQVSISKNHKLHNSNVSAKKMMKSYDTIRPLQKRIDLLIDAMQLITQVKERSNFLSNPETQGKFFHNSNLTLKNIYSYITFFSTGFACLENDSLKSLEHIFKGLIALKKSCQLEQDSDQIALYNALTILALKHSAQIYLDITSSNVSLFKGPATHEKYHNLKQTLGKIQKVISFFEQEFHNTWIEIGREVAFIEKALKNECVESRNYIREVFQKLPPTLDSETCKHLLLNTYCGILKSASNTAFNYPGKTEGIISLFQQQGTKHLDEAIKTYKEKIYKGEYKDTPEKEEEFIRARLESLAENEQPLIDFYTKLRQEKKERREKDIAQLIKIQQEEREKQKEEKQKRDEDNRKAWEERAEKQRDLHASMSPEVSLIDESPSVIQKKIEECIQKKKKVKTRVEAKPLVIQTIEKDEKPNLPKPQIIILDPNNDYVFQCLIGKNKDRHITLDKVLALLQKGFSCKITNATGGGSHRKATAPNNCVWTIPPAWTGPIPAPYRHQLTEFLLIDMGITDGFLEVKGSK